MKKAVVIALSLLIGLIALPVFAGAVLVGSLGSLLGFGSSDSAGTCSQGVLAQAAEFRTAVTTWSAEQLDNANAIVGIGISRGFSHRDTKIALMTAMQESGLRMLPYGDRDSLALFQQRPSVMGGNNKPYWGTAEQIMDRTYTINRFYDEMERKVPNRDQMRETEVAQKIQVSAFPEAYQKWADESDAILDSSNFSEVSQDSSGIATTASAACSDISLVAAEAPSGDGSWMIPVDKSAYRVTSGYGMRWGALHDGIDLAAPSGTPIYAASSGTIVEWRLAPGGGWGNTVVIDHGNGVRTRYAHMTSATQLLGHQVGQRVDKGFLVGFVGTTGSSTGNHLHLTIYLNCPGQTSHNSVCDTVDPVQFYGSRGLYF